MIPFSNMFLSLLAAAPTWGSSPRRDGATLLNDLRRLSVVGSALYVAAHPDDENTRLLATLSNETLVRTAYLSFTRGEGGQNLIGSELGPLLGVIRTQELLAARRVDGAEQYFTRARDFGYSKSVEETLATWDADAVLADAVFVIRTLRPDVIITRFSLKGGDTHGHHTASARLAFEAFRAAADPNFHPEQLTHAPVWQAKRIVWNAWKPDGAEALPSDTLKWDSSLYSPLLGASYGEIAAESRSMHKSQGFGAAPVHGPSPEYFVPLAGEPAQQTLFDGVDLTWRRVPGAEKLAALLSRATREYRVENPAASVPVLLAAFDELRQLPESPLKQQKLSELSEVIANCAGLFVEATANTPSARPGASVTVNAVALNRSPVDVSLERLTIGDSTVTPSVRLLRGKAEQQQFVIHLSNETPLTTPYWLERPPAKGVWNIDEKHPIGAAETAPALRALFTIEADGRRLLLERPVAFKWVEPTAGERFRPLEVLPPLSVHANEGMLAFIDNRSKPLKVKVTAHADEQRGEVSVELPQGFQVQPPKAAFALSRAGDTAEFIFQVRAPSLTPSLPLSLAEARIVAAQYSQSVSFVDYPHIPKQTVLFPATVKLVQFNLKRGGTKKIGYIEGAGDDVAQALRQVGYDVTVLDKDALNAESLKPYHAIVIGVRAFNTKGHLSALHGQLMQYVANGGVLLAQYNTRNWLSTIPAQMGPHTFEVSQDRVTEEDAEVTFTAPTHRVLRQPNILSQRDFEGWVQERGLYFGSKWAPQYETPLSMHDRGEAPLQGSLLIARYGKGRFVYTGLSFFRQLPAGVPGAFRLFANLIDRER